MTAALDLGLTEALRRLTEQLTSQTPTLAGLVAAWQRALAGGREPAAYFQNPLGFPLLRLPIWFEAGLGVTPHPGVQADLIFSSVNGYYFIRLLDNVMDGQATVERQLLPAAAIFHTNFQTPYQRLFPAGHPFWEDFTRLWFHSAEVTVQDAQTAEHDAAAFQRWAAHKVSAAKIPLAALGRLYQQREVYREWAQLVDALGAWHQAYNDLFDWSKDLRLGTPTHFLWEGARRKAADESIASWVTRAGFAWGAAQLRAGLAEVRALAANLHSPGLLAYLDERAALLETQAAAVAPDLARLARLAAAMPLPA